MSNKKSEIEAFLAEAAEQQPKTEAVFPIREKIKAQFDTLYNGYIVESYNEGIEGEYGVSTAVNMIDTNNDGRRVTLWVGGYETNHFSQFVEAQAANGNSLPLAVSFLRTKQTSEKSGRQFNKMVLRLDSAGDDVVIPPIPADQVPE
jgi:hypothetical protein